MPSWVVANLIHYNPHFIDRIKNQHMAKIRAARNRQQHSIAHATSGNILQDLPTHVLAKQGSYSQVRLVKLEYKDLQELARKLGNGPHAIKLRMPRFSGTKVFLVKESEVLSGYREARIQLHLTRQKPIVLQCKKMTLDIRKHVPKMILGGEWGMHYVALSEYIQNGRSMADVEITPKIKENYKIALMALMAAGVVHGDLHLNNILVLPNDTIIFIDFGFGFKLSKASRALVLQRLCTQPLDIVYDHKMLKRQIAVRQALYGRNMYHRNNVTPKYLN
jgi:serine/threonine protein kinase